MQVAKRPQDAAREEQIRQQLTALLQRSEIAPPVCGPSCPHHLSRTPEFDCSPNCADNRLALSSEPDRFPVEAKIAPLVFELKRLGCFDPCWSCEGHRDQQGKLQRTPAVWFYCDDVLPIRLLSDGLADLRAKGRLSCPWLIHVTYTEAASADTTFALEPLVEDRSSTELETLQADAALITREMQTLMRGQAQDLLWSLDK